MKIAIVSEYFYPTLGGISENIYHFSKELLRHGHDFRIVTGFRGAPKEMDGEVAGRIVYIGRNIPIFFNSSCGRLTVGANMSKKIKALFRIECFDLIHLHSPMFPTLPAIANMQADAPVVATFHTCTSGELFYYKLYRKSLQMYLNRMAGRIAVSKCCAQENQRHFNAHFDVIPNGVDVNWWTGEKSKLPKFDDGKTNILFLGRPDRRNGLDTLIGAFTRVHHDHPDTRLIIVGDGPLAFHFKGLVPDKIKDSVVFEGSTNGSRPDYVCTADIFCFTPTIASFGVTILEGMSAGRAIVASDIEAFRALVTNEESALLVPPQDERKLADAIGRLIEDKALRERLARKARSLADKYDWSRVAGMQIDYYNKILNS